ncbi:hypothetical protein ABZ319_34920 [Nocardia sp. NPDC005978]|uniref:hypothetical protein n=1 Tax=Nocardia sp. NPDC005978 TaxID=3156725 RepID=UPI0033B6CFC1
MVFAPCYSLRNPAEDFGPHQCLFLRGILKTLRIVLDACVGRWADGSGGVIAVAASPAALGSTGGPGLEPLGQVVRACLRSLSAGPRPARTRFIDAPVSVETGLVSQCVLDAVRDPARTHLDLRVASNGVLAQYDPALSIVADGSSARTPAPARKGFALALSVNGGDAEAVRDRVAETGVGRVVMACANPSAAGGDRSSNPDPNRPAVEWKPLDVGDLFDMRRSFERLVCTRGRPRVVLYDTAPHASPTGEADWEDLLSDVVCGFYYMTTLVGQETGVVLVTHYPGRVVNEYGPDFRPDLQYFLTAGIGYLCARHPNTRVQLTLS